MWNNCEGNTCSQFCEAKIIWRIHRGKKDPYLNISLFTLSDNNNGMCVNMIQTEESNGAVVVNYINQKRKMVWDRGKCNHVEAGSLVEITWTLRVLAQSGRLLFKM